jgi:hypothetical protein
VRKPLLAIALVVLTGCSAGPGYQAQTLPSGKIVKVLGVTQMSFAKGDSALILKYQTDLPIDDIAALAKEADEIWPSFRVDVEKAGLSNAVMSATSPPNGFIVKQSKSYTFVYTRDQGGNWSRGKK